jgi:ketosteroid isomerase-like protein
MAACGVAILLPGCAAATHPRSGSAVRGQHEVRAALAHYATLVKAMDNPAIAAMFTSDGEIVNRGQPSIKGPAAIEAFLQRFSDYHVLSEKLTPASTTVDGNHAAQEGTYRQRVRGPDGHVLNVSGRFIAEWIRDDNGIWRIRKMGTSPR